MRFVVGVVVHCSSGCTCTCTDRLRDGGLDSTTPGLLSQVASTTVFGQYVKRIHKRCYGQTTPDTYFLTDPYVGHGPSMEIKEIMSTLTLVVNSLEEISSVSELG